MSKIRQRLSSKHQEIAEKLSVMLGKNVKDQAQVSLQKRVLRGKNFGSGVQHLNKFGSAPQLTLRVQESKVSARMFMMLQSGHLLDFNLGLQDTRFQRYSGDIAVHPYLVRLQTKNMARIQEPVLVSP